MKEFSNNFAFQPLKYNEVAVEVGLLPDPDGVTNVCVLLHDLHASDKTCN